jgi:integrase
LRRALAHAEQWGMVSQNAAAKVAAPNGHAHNVNALSEADARQLIDAAERDRLEALWLVAVMVGLRKGEALALTWGDVDALTLG